jgi:nitrogen fixation protein FixH
MSWGIKITILYCSFVAMILTMVILTIPQKPDLVAENYYELELQYQEKLDRMNRTRLLPESLRNQNISGEVYFFCPSAAAMDKKVPIQLDSAGSMLLTTANMKPGLYKMEISWKANNADYFNESVIQLH